MTQKKTTEPRANFRKSTAEIIFKRAEGRCSVPRCVKPAMGPAMASAEAINMGMACHIYSAAAGGPRGQGGKEKAFISSAENGIWCCFYHGTLIDKSNGLEFSAETLFAWKKLAEARAAKRMNDIPSPLGWVESVEFTKFRGSKDFLPKVTLSRNTLLCGGMGSGKSVLMELAASISNSRHMKRFSSMHQRFPDTECNEVLYAGELLYSTVDTHSKKITLTFTRSSVERKENGVAGLLPPGDIEIVFFSSKDVCRQLNEDDIQLMMRILNVDETALFSLANAGSKNLLPCTIKFQQGEIREEFHEFKKRRHEDGEPYMELLVQRDGRELFTSFNNLANSEKMLLLNDLLINKAREVARQRLTLFLVDNTIGTLDPFNFKRLLCTLASEQFQSMVVLPPVQEPYLLRDVENGRTLADLDHLNPWRLVEFDAFDA